MSTEAAVATMPPDDPGRSRRDVVARTVAKNLRSRMLRGGLSQLDVVGMTGIARSSLNDYLRALRAPPAESLARLARALSCTTDQLLGLRSRRR